MPRKIRELKAELRKGGFVLLPDRGKGSHTVWEHPFIPDEITLSGQDGEDVKYYQEKQVREALAKARDEQRRQQQ